MATTRRLWFVCSLLLLTHCARSGDSQSERTAAVGQPWSSPLTITLSAPNPLSPLAPVALGSDSIALGTGAGIPMGIAVAMGNDGLNAGTSSTLGDAWSRGPAQIHSNATVSGTLHATTVTRFAPTAVANIDSAPIFDPTSTLSWTVTIPPGSPPGFTLNAGQSQTLAPGAYGLLEIHTGATLTLTAGTYYFSDIDVHTGASVLLAQQNGPVIIYVKNSIALRDTIAPVGGGAPDLLVAYLGTTSLTLSNLFNGALIAPLTTITLPAVGSPYAGYFAGTGVILNQNAQVQYAPPLAVVAAAEGGDPATCETTLSGIVPPGTLAAQAIRYCHTCQSPDDTDKDGVPDCVDRCPYDPNKTSPGLCGCGTADVDTDHDGVPDCIDQCPLDPNNTTPGECGCVGQAGLQAAGTPCTDSACPQPGATCNGAGVCGSRAACQPAPGCELMSWHEVSYWVCGQTLGGSDGGASSGRLSETAAQQACSAKGLTLTRVNSLSENRLLNKFLTAPLWLGANDLSASGTWRWSAPLTNNGDPFWSGGATGSATGSRFSNWAPGAPGSQRCAAIQPSDGSWTDVSCSETLGYICEYRVPFGILPDGGPVPPISPPGMPDQPPQLAGACVPEPEAGLPDSTVELQNEIMEARNGTFVGAAAHPPPDGSVCTVTPSAEGLGSQQGARDVFLQTHLRLSA